MINFLLVTLRFPKNTVIFLNEGKAKTEDIEKLIEKVKTEVKNKTGINLELEIKIIGNER